VSAVGSSNKHEWTGLPAEIERDSLRAALIEEKTVVRDLLHGTERLKAALAKAEGERDEAQQIADDAIAHALARANAAEAKLAKATEALDTAISKLASAMWEL
jgi:multidrug resistance efflux pump